MNNLYVVFINPLFYKSNDKLTQVECHFFNDFGEAADFAEENGGVEVYSRVYWNETSENEISNLIKDGVNASEYVKKG